MNSCFDFACTACTEIFSEEVLLFKFLRSSSGVRFIPGERKSSKLTAVAASCFWTGFAFSVVVFTELCISSFAPAVAPDGGGYEVSGTLIPLDLFDFDVLE
jgi:hypothetical protein